MLKQCDLPDQLRVRRGGVLELGIPAHHLKTQRGLERGMAAEAPDGPLQRVRGAFQPSAVAQWDGVRNLQ